MGRIRSDDDDFGSAFSFLASDNEEEESRACSQNVQKTVKMVGSKEIQTHVFMWGLNDKDQLGGPKGSKVRHDHME